MKISKKIPVYVFFFLKKEEEAIDDDDDANTEFLMLENVYIFRSVFMHAKYSTKV